MPGNLPDDVTQARIDRELDGFERDVVDDEALGQPDWLEHQLRASLKQVELPAAKAAELERRLLREHQQRVLEPIYDPRTESFDCPVAPWEGEEVVPPDHTGLCVDCGKEVPAAELFEELCRGCQQDSLDPAEFLKELVDSVERYMAYPIPVRKSLLMCSLKAAQRHLRIADRWRRDWERRMLAEGREGGL